MKYRALNVQLLPAGSEHVIAHFPQARQTAILPAELARQLRQLRAFRELDDHVEHLVRAAGGDRAKAAAIVHQLVAGGLLVAADKLSCDAAPEPRASIDAFGVITCRRIKPLARALASYGRNFAASGRAPEVIVADDDRDGEGARRCRGAVAGLALEIGRPIFYAGVEQKAKLAKQLALATGVPGDVVRFALLGTAGVETIGANRNALLLLAAGKQLLSADDDSVCQLFESPDATASLAVGDEQDPTAFWFFPSRVAALAGRSAIERDVLAAHERLLGRRLDVLASETDVVLGDTCDHVFEAWAAGTARVRMSFAGTLGDCGMHSSAPLRHLRGASRARLAADHAIATTSREVLRVVPGYTVTHGPPYMAGSHGLDARSLVPPYFPVLRNEDGVFGATLRAIAPDALFGHVPLAVLHDAAPDRRYADDSARPRMSELLIALIGRARLVAGTDAERMIALGRHLQDLGTSAAFADAAATALLPAFSFQLELIERELAQKPAWARDLVARRDAILRAITAEPYWIPQELAAADDALATTRHWVRQLGELLEAWPVLIRAATSLDRASLG